MPALYQVRLHIRDAGGHDFENVFGYYDQLALPVSVDSLVTEFIAQIVPAVMQVCTGGVDAYRVQVAEVNDPTIFRDTAISPPISGGRGGDGMPNFVAWNFQYVRAVRGQKSGRKAIGPISESDQSFGSWTSAAKVVLDDTAAKLGAAIKVGLVDTWFPVILVRSQTLPVVWTKHDISSVKVNSVSTQNTRKR